MRIKIWRNFWLTKTAYRVASFDQRGIIEREGRFGSLYVFHKGGPISLTTRTESEALFLCPSRTSTNSYSHFNQLADTRGRKYSVGETCHHTRELYSVPKNGLWWRIIVVDSV
jgi:hypothetical protein